MTQTFHRGNLVYIAEDLGPMMSHFKSGCEAIIIGSYADQYGGRDTGSYTVMLMDGCRCSWYYETQMTLVDEGGEHLIERVTRERDAREQIETDMPWIIKNWPKIRERVSGATLSELMRRIGITNPWGVRGEGITLYENQMFTFGALDEALKSGDEQLVSARISEIRDWLATQPDPCGCRGGR